MGPKNGAGANGHLPKPIDKGQEKPAEKPDKRRGAKDAHSHPMLANHEARRVAVDAVCDERSVFAYLHGFHQRPMMRARIEKALKSCGHEHLIGYATRSTAVAAANRRAADGRED